MNDRRYGWAAAAAAQLVNLHLDKGECKAIVFQRYLSVIYDALRMSDIETRETLLKPSEN